MDPHTPPRPYGRALSGPEREGLRRFRDGDPRAFQALVRPHLSALLGLARRVTGDPHWAEDLVQEVLVRAYRGLEGFRGEAPLRSWLFRILVRLGAEPRRWRREEPVRVRTDQEIPDHLDLGPDAGVLERELRERLDAAMERLTPRQRTALHLRAAEGLDYFAIAGVLETSEGAARMLVLAARRKVLARVREYLEP